MNRKPGISVVAALLALTALVTLQGCASLREEKATELTYAEPKVPPLAPPDTVETSRFLGTLPSGRLYDLHPNKIAVAALSDYQAGSDPRTYLNNLVRKEKSRGSSYLPYHFYVTPEGQIFQGQSEGRCGYLEGQLVKDTFLIGVFGDYNDPTNFMPETQQMALIQLCAWLCHQNSISSQSIVPATQLNPKSPPLGENLSIWFGPTQTLRTRVDSTLAQGAEEKKEKGLQNPFYHGDNKQDEISTGF
jgi:hypothetical protein